MINWGTCDPTAPVGDRINTWVSSGCFLRGRVITSPRRSRHIAADIGDHALFVGPRVRRSAHTRCRDSVAGLIDWGTFGSHAQGRFGSHGSHA